MRCTPPPDPPPAGGADCCQQLVVYATLRCPCCAHYTALPDSDLTSLGARPPAFPLPLHLETTSHIVRTKLRGTKITGEKISQGKLQEDYDLKKNGKIQFFRNGNGGNFPHCNEYFFGKTESPRIRIFFY